MISHGIAINKKCSHKKCVKVKTSLNCGMKIGNVIGFCGEAKVGYKLAK